MDNPKLISKLRDHFLIKPVEESKGKRTHYNLLNMSLIDPSMGQAAEIGKIIDYTVIHFNTYKYINVWFLNVVKN